MADDSAIISRAGKKGAIVETMLRHKNGDLGPDRVREAELKEPPSATAGQELRTYSLTVMCSDGRPIQRTLTMQSPEIVLPDNATPEQIEGLQRCRHKAKPQ